MYYQWSSNNLILTCRVRPNAKCDKFAEATDEYININIAAPPVDGKANKKLVKFLSRQFKVPQSHIQITSGTKNRMKFIRINVPNFLPPTLDITRP